MKTKLKEEIEQIETDIYNLSSEASVFEHYDSEKRNSNIQNQIHYLRNQINKLKEKHTQLQLQLDKIYEIKIN